MKNNQKPSLFVTLNIFIDLYLYSYLYEVNNKKNVKQNIMVENKLFKINRKINFLFLFFDKK